MALVGAGNAQVIGQEEDLVLAYGDKATVSIATGAKTSLRRAPAVATVVTAEDIAAMGATDLDEVMEAIPGVHVSRSPNSYNPLYVIRGIFSQTNPQVLMLQNGVPVTTMLFGSKGNIWGGFPIEHIARIEVIRGPGSALYGADAYAGVINIITKSAADTPGTQIGARIGSFASHSAWVQHGGQLGPVDVSAYLRIGATDGGGEIVASDAQSVRDRIGGTKASLAPGPLNTGYDAIDANLEFGYGKWRMHAGYKLRDDVGTGAGVASALDPVGKGASRRFNADLSWTDPEFARRWGLGFTASFLNFAQLIPVPLRLFPPGSKFGGVAFPEGQIGSPETWENQWRYSGFATYSGFAGHSLRVGVGHDDLDLYRTSTHKNYINNAAGMPILQGPVGDYTDTSPFMLPQRRRVDYVYIQDEWSLAHDWTITAGVRRDRYSDFGGTTNPRLAVVWDAAHDLTAKLLVARAFRAPSFNEQHGINNPVLAGNPALQPETIRTTEAAVAWQLRKDAELNVSLFRYDMDNIIRPVTNPGGVTGATYFNTGSQSGRGIELEVAWDASRSVRLTGSHSYQHSIDAATATDAGMAPRHHLYLRADWQHAGGMLLCAQVNAVADRKRVAGDGRRDVPDYTTLDLSVRTASRPERWVYSAGVRNLFDAEVYEPSPAATFPITDDLPTGRRAAYLQAVYRL